MPDALSILYDHYKDTCSAIGEAIRRRERLMLIVILTLGLFAFQTAFPATVDEALSAYLLSEFGVAIQVNLSVIGTVLWFMLLAVTVRYFQTVILIERRYEYVHQLEEHLNEKLEGQFITREGKGYLTRYPWFSDWTWILYTIVFPLLLLVVTIVKVIYDWRLVMNDGFSLTLLLNTVAFALLSVSTVLYLIMIHSPVRNPADTKTAN